MVKDNKVLSKIVLKVAKLLKAGTGFGGPGAGVNYFAGVCTWPHLSFSQWRRRGTGGGEGGLLASPYIQFIFRCIIPFRIASPAAMGLARCFFISLI